MDCLYASLIALLSQFAFQIYAKRYGFRTETVQSLCDDPVIYAADRLLNNSVRLYRGNHYWELKGIPGKGFLDGPHLMWYKNFGNTTKNTGLVTFLSGHRKGYLIKFQGQKWWAWQPDGHQGWGDHGVPTHQIPKGGFKAVFHNGNLTDPMLIGLESIKVYYYNTKVDIYNNGMSFVGNNDGYMGGQFGENFPPDITAAFSYPSIKPNDGYFVYLFKNDKYCFRAANRKDSTQPCDEWKPNRELFGCDGSSPPELSQPPQPEGSQPTQPDFTPQAADEIKIGRNNTAITQRIVSPLLSVFPFIYVFNVI